MREGALISLCSLALLPFVRLHIATAGNLGMQAPLGQTIGELRTTASNTTPVPLRSTGEVGALGDSPGGRILTMHILMHILIDADGAEA